MRTVLLRPALEVTAVHGLLGWLYVAAVAAVRPDDLTVPITSLLPLRRDTFGTCCFAASAAAAFALQAGARSPLPWAPDRPRRAPRPGPVDAALRTVLAYGLVVWAYLAVNSLTHPETIALRLTHFAPFPTEGATAVACFAASAAALVALRVRIRAAAGGDAA
ncbi:hypothetical protein [Streptomyces specialis]|uniref:hypothetical protein n=1 Tax=Streptomyces specialis TaxID=498367 RepID=UPI00073E5154|nr:hypothetical protein [Streptomyces specialis]